MEVELPIVPDCDPNNVGVFCAGHPEGGFDTCFGMYPGSHLDVEIVLTAF